MSAAHKELEVELHGAFYLGEFYRLGRFAHWCAAQATTPSMPTSWRAAPDLAGERERLAPADFSAHAEARKENLALATMAIGLRQGDPGAMRLLTIAAAISTGPLNSALQASSNQRQYERIVAELRLGQDLPNAVPTVVALDGPTVLNDEGATVSASSLSHLQRPSRWRRPHEGRHPALLSKRQRARCASGQCAGWSCLVTLATDAGTCEEILLLVDAAYSSRNCA